MIAKTNQELVKLDLDPIAEQGIEDLYCGMSLAQAAEKQGIGKTTLVRHLVSNPTYEERYARSLVCKGVLFAEEIVQVARDLTSDSTQADIAKARLLSDNLKWTSAKFWQHLSPEVQAKAGLSITIPTQTQPLTIQLVSNPPQPSTSTISNDTDAIDVETQSQ